MKIRTLVALIWMAWSVPCFAQGAANSIVKADSLSVYSDANASSEVVRTLKKGDSLFVSLELQTGGEKWCSVRIPGESARLGYVECDGLQRIDRRPGDLALPKDSIPMSGAPPSTIESGQPAPIRLPRARSELESTTEYERVAALVVRDDVLDGAKIAEFDQAAQSGSAAPMTRAALAHEAAGFFELNHDDSDDAIEQFRAALPLAAKQPAVLFGALINLSYIHLVLSKYSAALEYLDQARRISPGAVVVAQLSGWAYYGLNRLDEAIKEWEVSQKISPDPDTAAALEKARRDQNAEQLTRSAETTHFTLRYQGGATPQLALEILRTLEAHFRSLQTDLQFTPADPIGVILYTGESFRDTTRAPSWVAARNDGRIRVPVQGLVSVSDELSRLLKHELTHSFIRQLTLGDCPQWLNEGMAQWMEGRRSAENARGLISAYSHGEVVSLKSLEGSWDALPQSAATAAYALSLAAVESIMAMSGPIAMNRLLGNLSTAPSVDGALRQALQIGYADVDKQTAEYIRRTYK
jgi:tetratricopeptide (TPR) repeat protein